MSRRIDVLERWPNWQSLQRLVLGTAKDMFHLHTMETTPWLRVRKEEDTRGVYLIVNSHTGRGYVGSSERCRFRLREHFSALRKGKHVNIHLQRSWLLSTLDFWSWSILTEVQGTDARELLAVEQYWMDTLDSVRSGYNMSLVAGSPMKGRKHTPEAKRLCAIASAKLNRKDPEYRAKISAATKGERNPMFGKVVTQETRDRISAANMGKTHTAETRALQSLKAKAVQGGLNNGFFGRKHRPETKARLIANLGASRTKANENSRRRKGKTWVEQYGPEVAAQMSLNIAASNRRRAHAHVQKS